MDRSGHSSLGIASFCVSVFSILLFLFWLILAGAGGGSTIVGLVLIFQVFVSIVGTGLGITPLFSTSKNRGFAITGVVIGSATAVITLGVLGIGIFAK